MYDIKHLNIWKEEPTPADKCRITGRMTIEDLNLSVRSYNCLMRAGCRTVDDIRKMVDIEGNGLRRIRNLGYKSEHEILQKLYMMEVNEKIIS